MKRAVALVAMALALVVSAESWAVEATSITTTYQAFAEPRPMGIRVGAWYDADAKKKGAFTYSIVYQEWDYPLAPSSNTLVNDWTWSNNNLTTDCTNFSSTTLEEAHTILIWPNFTNSAAYSTESVNTSMTITGTDLYGIAISDVVDVEATSGTTGSFETDKAFLTVTSISWTDPDATDDDVYTSDNVTFDIGVGRYLGLKYCMHIDTRLKELVDADGTGGLSADSAGSIIVGDSNGGRDWRGCWKPNDVPDGTSDYALFWIITDIAERYNGDLIDPMYGRY